MQRILVTGGAGYIGSHTCVELLDSGYDVVVVDNFSNSKPEAIERVKKITQQSVEFINVDLTNKEAIFSLIKKIQFDAVIHFAGLKAVGESTQIPLHYYQNNVTATLNLCEAMAMVGRKNLVFSSSATVYGEPAELPITENFPTCTTNPYGRSKLFIEQILADLYQSDSEWNIARLRYFNPVGAHSSGLIGEDPNGIPNNLLPYISQVAVGKLEKLNVYGNDYDTPDGTGVRDYIHVVDLAKGHLKALEKLKQKSGLITYNLGTGKGYSVLETIKAFEQASQRKIKFEIVGRRFGDIATCYADPSLAERELGWKAQYGIEQMTKDAWNWQNKNPQGYT